MSFLDSFKSEIKTFVADLEKHMGKRLGEVEQAMAAMAKHEVAALTPAVWAEMQVLGKNIVEQVEKGMVGTDSTIKWNTAMSAFTHGIESVGVQGVKFALSQPVKDTLLQSLVMVLKAGAVAAIAS